MRGQGGMGDDLCVGCMSHLRRVGDSRGGDAAAGAEVISFPSVQGVRPVSESQAREEAVRRA